MEEVCPSNIHQLRYAGEIFLRKFFSSLLLLLLLVWIFYDTSYNLPQALKLMIPIPELEGSNLVRDTDYHDRGSTWCFSVPPTNFRNTRIILIRIDRGFLSFPVQCYESSHHSGYTVWDGELLSLNIIINKSILRYSEPGQCYGLCLDVKSKAVTHSSSVHVNSSWFLYKQLRPNANTIWAFSWWGGGVLVGI
jgi:hypothetical protein